MAYGRSRRRRGGDHGVFWPGYVDVLSTLLLVVTFLMSIFMVAQFYVSQEASGKDTALRRLTRQIAELTNLLSLEKGKSKSIEDELSALQAIAVDAQVGQRAPDRTGRCSAAKRMRASPRLPRNWPTRRRVSNEALAKVDLLNQQLLALRRQMAALQEALRRRRSKDKESQARITDLGARLNVVLAKQVQELQRYRSDFFGRLRELLRDRKDIRVVGDRFVFESEVLFPSGQATMTVEGLAAIDQLATAIVELERSIPHEIDWALQVDGHTDIRRDRQPAVPVELGAVERARHLGREVPDQPRRPAQAPGGGRLRRVPAARGRHDGRGPAPQPPHRAEADEQVIQRGDDV